MSRRIEKLRAALDNVDDRLVSLLGERGRLLEEAAAAERERGDEAPAPQRADAVAKAALRANPGPFPDDAVEAILHAVTDESRALLLQAGLKRLRVQRAPGEPSATVPVGNAILGEGLHYIAGPCAVEDEALLDEVASVLADAGVRLLRGGAFKPRTSPYTFQGHGRKGLEILRRVADRYGMGVVTEVMDTRDVPVVAEYADMVQVGARSMFHYPLLRDLGAIDRPVLLKRSFGATLDEFLLAAEYLMAHGNDQVVLCERGIRTFERATRNTLDLSALPLLRRRTSCPIVVDVSHAAGRRDILGDLTAASFVSGAAAVMIEVHADPPKALSDSKQQLTPAAFLDLMREVRERFQALAPQAP